MSLAMVAFNYTVIRQPILTPGFITTAIDSHSVGTGGLRDMDIAYGMAMAMMEMRRAT